MVNDLFLHEYLGKPENRVNVALLALMQQQWFREWFLKKLDLPIDSIVYPPSNRNGHRPDLKVVNPARPDGTLAWIEVELGKNIRQLEDYQRSFHPDKVKAVWGKRGHDGDLSLEEVAKFLKNQTELHPQVTLHVQQLTELICEGLAGYSSSPGRSALSPEMKNHELVVGLCRLLEGKIRFNLDSKGPPPCYFKMDTTDTPNNQGFSLRVYSPKSSNGTLSIMSITAGRDKVYFPSLPKLERYLPNCPDEVEAYRSMLCRMKLNIGKFDLRQRPWLCLSTVLDHLDELVPCLEALADCYGNCTE